MLKPPIIIKFAIWTQALPLLAYVASPARTRAAGYVVLGSVVSVLANALGFWLADLFGNSHITSYISSPITAACYFAAMGEWQVTPRERRIVRLLIVPFVLVWMGLVGFVEDVRGFDVVTAPLYSVGILLAALWTILRRGSVTIQTPLHRLDWFWVLIGMAINGAVTSLANPLGGYFFAQNRLDLFDLVWRTRSTFVTLSFVAISWGVYRGPSISKYAAQD